jgi:hypothetical protein
MSHRKNLKSSKHRCFELGRNSQATLAQIQRRRSQLQIERANEQVEEGFGQQAIGLDAGQYVIFRNQSGQEENFTITEPTVLVIGDMALLPRPDSSDLASDRFAEERAANLSYFRIEPEYMVGSGVSTEGIHFIEVERSVALATLDNLFHISIRTLGQTYRLLMLDQLLREEDSKLVADIRGDAGAEDGEPVEPDQLQVASIGEAKASQFRSQIEALYAVLLQCRTYPSALMSMESWYGSERGIVELSTTFSSALVNDSLSDRSEGIVHTMRNQLKLALSKSRQLCLAANDCGPIYKNAHAVEQHLELAKAYCQRLFAK